MDNISKIDQANKIIDNLISEFSKEEGKVQVLFDNNSSKIIELDENISNYKKNDDMEYKVFSPRNQVSVNKDRLESLRSERDTAEKTKTSLTRQLKYYSDKCQKLMELKSLFSDLEYEEKSSSISDLDDIHEVTVKSSELIPDDKAAASSVQITDSEISDKFVYAKEELERIFHRMEMIGKIIENDPLRAKIEYNSALSNLNDIISTL